MVERAGAQRSVGVRGDGGRAEVVAEDVGQLVAGGVPAADGDALAAGVVVLGLAVAVGMRRNRKMHRQPDESFIKAVELNSYMHQLFHL